MFRLITIDLLIRRKSSSHSSFLAIAVGKKITTLNRVSGGNSRKNVYTYSRFSELYITFIPFIYLIAVGYNPGDSSSTRRDFSILRLSTEVPFGIKAVIKPCSDKCKSERKPFELALSFGFSEAVGRLSIGFGETSYELPALSRKLYGGGWEPRYVCLIRGQARTSPPSGRGHSQIWAVYKHVPRFTIL